MSSKPPSHQKTFTTQTTRSPSSPDMATCMGRCLSKSGIIGQGSDFAAFRLVFGRCFLFMVNLCSEKCPQRVVRSSGGPFGWCCFSSSLLLVVLPSFSSFGKWSLLRPSRRCFYFSFSGGSPPTSTFCDGSSLHPLRHGVRHLRGGDRLLFRQFFQNLFVHVFFMFFLYVLW